MTMKLYVMTRKHYCGMMGISQSEASSLRELRKQGGPTAMFVKLWVNERVIRPG